MIIKMHTDPRLKGVLGLRIELSDQSACLAWVKPWVPSLASQKEKKSSVPLWLSCCGSPSWKMGPTEISSSQLALPYQDVPPHFVPL